MTSFAANVVGVWEIHAPDAPFPWHVMTFTPYGTVIQSNPPAGNQTESDSNGHGIWQTKMDANHQVVVIGKLIEYKADHTTGAYIGKGVITFQFTVKNAHFTGTADAYQYDSEGVCVAGPLSSPLDGTRITLDGTELPMNNINVE